MNDWNSSGNYDMGDRYIDYHGASGVSKRVVSGLFLTLLLLCIVSVCPILGVIIVIVGRCIEKHNE